MKKGRKFYENENLIIYVGTAIFFILAISVGIVMYMTTKANSKVGNETGKSTTENIENVEDASSNIGKTVEVLIEEKKDGFSYGHTGNYLHVKTKNNLEHNTFHNLKITDIDYPYCIGE